MKFRISLNKNCLDDGPHKNTSECKNHNTYTNCNKVDNYFYDGLYVLTHKKRGVV